KTAGRQLPPNQPIEVAPARRQELARSTRDDSAPPDPQRDRHPFCIPSAAISDHPRNCNVPAPSTLLGPARRRAYRLPHYNSVTLGMHVIVHNSGLGSPAAPPVRTEIIVPDAIASQGERLTASPQYRRKLSDVACEHHFICRYGTP